MGIAVPRRWWWLGRFIDTGTTFSRSGMKQDLQNLREEIKQLGREIRGQLKGKFLEPPSLWLRAAPDISGECGPERPTVYPGHIAV